MMRCSGSSRSDLDIKGTYSYKTTASASVVVTKRTGKPFWRNQAGNSHSLDLSLNPVLTLRLAGFAILLCHADDHLSLLHGPPCCCGPPFRHIHAEPRHETCKTAENKQDWEGLPIVSFLVDYGLDHIRSNN